MRPAILLNHDGIDYKCRLKYDRYITNDQYWDEMKTFSIELDYSEKQYIKGIYESYLWSAPLWIWPQCVMIPDLDIQHIKNNYIMFPGNDCGDGFSGYKLNNALNVPLLLNDSQELRAFCKTPDATMISKKNGGF